jgi:hypothetical protein
MPFLTRPHFEDRQIVQYGGESIKLSGLTKIAPTLLYENPFNTGQTSVTIMGVTGYLNEGVNDREYGFMVQPPILKLSGSTGYTTTDVTGYVLKALDSGGTVTWSPISVSADTNTFVTGGTLNGTNLDLTWNTGGSVPSIDLSPLSSTFTGNTSGDCITDLYITNLYGCSPLHIEPSGVNDVYIVENGGNVGIGTTTPSEKLHVKDGSALIEHNQDASTRLDIKNYNGGNDAFAQFALSVSGTSSSNAKFGSIIAVGPDSVPTGSFMGSYLPNSLNIITANGSAATRMHINIGSRRTNGETRFFSGEDFDVSNLVGVVYSTGLTITDMVNTNTLRVRNGANLGYVLTSDANGVGSWQASSGGGTFTGNTSASCITDLYVSNVYGCSPITIHDTITYNGSIIDSATTNSFIFGDSHVLTASTGTHGTDFDSNVILGGDSNRITPSQTGKNNTIIGGNTNEIGGVSRVDNNIILGSTNSFITNSYLSTNGVSILGGDNNSILGGGNSAIIGGQNNTILSSPQRAVILGGQNITGTTDDTVYVPNLIVTNDHILHSDSVLEVEDLPSTFEDELKGQVTYFSWSGLTTHTTSNDNPEGRVGFLMGNFSNFPTTKTYGFLTYYNSGYTRTGTSSVGADFYRDKLVLKAADGTNGIIINPQANNPSGNLWFEIGGSSVMKLKGDGTGKANLGIAMNPNGTEDATANLQIGGTGTTGTFKYVDGNEQSGYVLTSDSDGNASWAASAGGGGVTIDPYEDVGNVNSITWDVSGTSTNYEATLTGNTTLNLINVRNGDYGTLITTQDGVGGHTLTFGSGTHLVSNGGGGSPVLTATAGAVDILTFTYNGTNFYWTVGNDYT